VCFLNQCRHEWIHVLITWREYPRNHRYLRKIKQHFKILSSLWFCFEEIWVLQICDMSQHKNEDTMQKKLVIFKNLFIYNINSSVSSNQISSVRLIKLLI
jgi:hypothetical protein